jgi:hypothetical protein
VQLLQITLAPGATVKAEPGAIAFCSEGISVDTSLDGGLIKSLGRVVAGESLFTTVFTHEGHGKARVAFASPTPGAILPIKLSDVGGTLICQKDSFLCAARGVSLGIAFNRGFANVELHAGGRGWKLIATPLLQNLKLDNASHVRLLFRVLFFATQHRLRKPEFWSPGQPVTEPFWDANHTHLKPHDFGSAVFHRRSDDAAVKVYRDEGRRDRVLGALSILGDKYSRFADGRTIEDPTIVHATYYTTTPLVPLFELVMPWRRGSHVAQYSGQFYDIFCDLVHLHSNELVHGDVREQNLVFSGGEPRDLSAAGCAAEAPVAAAAAADPVAAYGLPAAAGLTPADFFAESEGTLQRDEPPSAAGEGKEGGSDEDEGEGDSYDYGSDLFADTGTSPWAAFDSSARPQAWLIDLDFVNTPSSKYVFGYNKSLRERSDIAASDLELMQPWHDLFALGTIMSYYMPRTPDARKKWAILIKKLRVKTVTRSRLEKLLNKKNWPAGALPRSGVFFFLEFQPDL